MKKLTFPHPLVLLLLCIIVAALASYIVPAGQFDRAINEQTGREVVVPGSYHAVDSNPVGFFQALVAVPLGLERAASVVFLVFLVGGAFVVIDKTGALNSGMEWLVKRLQSKELLVIPISILLFATLGALENFQEEIIPLVPVLLILCRRLGFDNLTAVAISIGAAIIGASFSPMNPFQVGIAQKLAELPLLSGSGYRMVFLVIALVAYIAIVWKRALKIRTAPELVETVEGKGITIAQRLVLVILLLTFVIFVLGVVYWGWGFQEMSAAFLLSGIICGLIGGLKVKGTTEAFIVGFQEMAYSAILIGFASGIFVVLEQGLIIDSIVHHLFSSIASLPKELSVTGITLIQTLIHFPVPSVSGQAVLTLPVLVPLSDLMGVSRQIMVMCYQYGAGMGDILTPTNGALMAIIAAAGVPFDQWFKFALKVYGILMAIALVAIYLAMYIGL
jgi:uncharacterized ion transporter superfamily protein YfcC